MSMFKENGAVPMVPVITDLRGFATFHVEQQQGRAKEGVWGIHPTVGAIVEVTPPKEMEEETDGDL